MDTSSQAGWCSPSASSTPQPPTGSPSPKHQQLLIGGAIAGAAALVIGGIALSGCGSDDSGSVSGPAGGAADATWCEFVEESDALGEMSFELSPSQLQQDITKAESIVQRLPSAAPDEITGAATRLAELNQLFYDAIKAADYVVLDADFSSLGATAEADIDAALTELDAYTERECGRGFTDGSASDDAGDNDDADDFDLTDGTMREQMVTELESIGFSSSEATCMAENLDFSDPALQDGDVDAMFADVIERCDVDPDRLTDLELGGG